MGNKIGEEQDSYLRPSKEGVGAVPKDPKTELLHEIIERMNDLLIEDCLTEADMLNYANTICGKVSEDEVAMDQLRSNSKEQAMLGLFPDSINKAVIESMGIHEKMAMKLLVNETVAQGFYSLMFNVMLGKHGKENITEREK